MFTIFDDFKATPGEVAHEVDRTEHDDKRPPDARLRRPSALRALANKVRPTYPFLPNTFYLVELTKAILRNLTKLV